MRLALFRQALEVVVVINNKAKFKKKTWCKLAKNIAFLIELVTK